MTIVASINKQQVHLYEPQPRAWPHCPHTHTHTHTQFEGSAYEAREVSIARRTSLALRSYNRGGKYEP